MWSNPSFETLTIKDEACLTPYYKYIYKTCNDLRFTIDGQEYKIQKGFHTDLASIPRFMWSFLSPRYSAFVTPAIIHDYLYNIDTKKGRRFADDVLFAALRLNGVSYYTSMKFWTGVRTFGWIHFKKNRESLKNPDLHNIYSEKERFDYAIKILLDHEGGYVSRKDDPGRETKWGVSLRFLILNGIDIDNDGDVDADDIAALNQKDAIQLYKDYWWNVYDYNKIDNIIVATKVFDLAVNMGANRAHRIFQESINELTEHKIKVDGIIGNKTIAEANKLNPDELMEKIRENAKKKYLQILKENPYLEWARNGWLNRAAW